MQWFHNMPSISQEILPMVIVNFISVVSFGVLRFTLIKRAAVARYKMKQSSELRVFLLLVVWRSLARLNLKHFFISWLESQLCSWSWIRLSVRIWDATEPVVDFIQMFIIVSITKSHAGNCSLVRAIHFDITKRCGKFSPRISRSKTRLSVALKVNLNEFTLKMKTRSFGFIQALSSNETFDI